MFGMISGIENGFTRSGPRSSSSLWQSWNALSPPIPVAIAAPMRAASGSISSPESASAWRAAATIRCAKRSIRRACLNGMYSVASKSFTSQAKWTVNRLESNWVISPAPERPASRPSHVDSTSLPSGVTAPRPVITTLRLPLRLAPVITSPIPRRRAALRP